MSDSEKYKLHPTNDKGGKFLYMGVSVQIEGKGDDHWQAVDIYPHVWGNLCNDSTWFLYLLDGQLAMGTFDLAFHANAETAQKGLDAIDGLLGGKREYLCHFHDTHYWVDYNGHVIVVCESDESDPLLRWTRNEKGEPTLTPCGSVEQYTIHPDHLAAMSSAVEHGAVLSPR